MKYILDVLLPVLVVLMALILCCMLIAIRVPHDLAFPATLVGTLSSLFVVIDIFRALNFRYRLRRIYDRAMKTAIETNQEVTVSIKDLF